MIDFVKLWEIFREVFVDPNFDFALFINTDHI